MFMPGAFAMQQTFFELCVLEKFCSEHCIIVLNDIQCMEEVKLCVIQLH